MAEIILFSLSSYWEVGGRGCRRAQSFVPSLHLDFFFILCSKERDTKESNIMVFKH